MLKLNASYSKKTKAEEEFSSKCFHASLEVEMPDGLTQEQLQARIHDTFLLVKESVENELNNGKANGNGQTVPVQVETEKSEAKANASNGNGKKPVVKASPAQVKFLLDLARDCQINIGKVLSKYGVENANDLDKSICSKLINEFKATAALA